MRSRFALLWVLVTAAIAGLAAYIAYGAGVATHVTTPAATDGALYYYHPFFGFGFGFFLPILVIVVLFWALRPRRWGRGGWGGHGMKGGFPQGVPPHLEQRLQEWHKSAHGEGSGTPPDAPTGGDRTVA